MGITWILLLGCTLLGIQQTYGYWPSDERPPLMSMGRPFHGFVVDPRSKEEKLLDRTVLNISWIPQVLDHFNPYDDRLWYQRYYTNQDNFRANDGNEVVFLIVGGEGVESGWWATLQGTPLMDMAKQYGAIIFDLEHRFYGRSRPFPLQTTLNMRYLTSHQAVEDIAAFIAKMNIVHQFKNPRWITFGCSYPGSLSAWVHELHFDLVTGSYSTSAAIEAQYDFYQYMEVVEEAITAYNPQCATAIEEGVTEMSRLIWTPEGRTTLSDVFSLVPRLNETQLSYMDIAYFMFSIHVNFQTAVQYSEDNAYIYNKAGGIPQVCGIMTNTTMDPLHRLAQVNIYMTEIFGYKFTHTYARYQGYIDYVKDVNYYGDGDDAASRGWVWQTCNEFGFLQSTDTGKNIFGSQTPANLFINWCSDIFGDDFKAMQVERKAHLTNKRYGGRENYFGMNAVFITGGGDPWYPLGVYMNQSSVVSYRSPGTAHCADMYVPRSTDKPGLAIARSILKKNVAKWLALPKKEQHKEDQSSDIRKPKAAPAQQLENIQSPGKFPEIKPIESTFETVPLPPFKEAMEPRHKKQSFYEGPAFFMGRPRGGLVPEPPTYNATDFPEGFMSGTVTQHVDNSNLSNSATYKQRYWYNPQYYQEGGPIFLFICGESPADIKWVLNPEVEIMTAARMYHAAVYMVEHRYYGQSWPTADLSTANLKWLNVEQALADLVNFIKGTNKKMNYTDPKWITFGGSYAGSMSAWMRLFRPNLVHGAMATSAPIEVKVDFYGYELQCQDSLRIFNPACAENIGIAFDDMHQMSLTGAGRAKLSTIFTLDPPWNATTPVTDLDIQHFFANQYQNFDSIVQYNNDNRGIYANGGGMREGCAIMQNNLRAPVENLAYLNKYVVTYPNGTFTSTWNSYADFVKYIQNDTSSWRTWTYQTCTQFGFFESTDIGYNIWGNSVPVNYWIAMCEDIFGPEFTSKRIYNAVHDLQMWTGGRDHFKGTNVMFTNGNIDPWSLQGIYVTNSRITSILMNGTAHCAEMYPPRAQDAPDLNVTRYQAYQTIGKWLDTTSFSPRTGAYSLVMFLAVIALLA